VSGSPISYDLVLHLEGTASDDLRILCKQSGDCHVDESNNQLKVILREEHANGQGLNGFLSSLLHSQAPIWAAASRIGTTRSASVAIYYDAERFASLSLGVGPAVMKSLSELGFELEMCAYPVADNAEDK
jgi:hypothetical protein